MPDILDRPSYEEDFHAWALDQAERLRGMARLRANEPVDWELLAGEVEDVGKSERHACESFVEQIIAHLLKLEHSAAVEPRPGREDEVDAARVGLERKLSPSIRRHLLQTMPRRHALAPRLLRRAVERDDPATWARLPAE